MPTLRFAVRIDAADGRAVRGLGLDIKLQIAAQLRRGHSDTEAERLRELFGAREEWARSLNAIPWAQTTHNVPSFEGSTLVEVRVPCTYDFEVAAAKYLAALDDGEVPLEMLFSGTLFYTAPDGRLQTGMISWSSEASVRMPVAVWQQAMRASFGDCGWLRLQRDVFARLQAERSRRGLTTWEDTLEALLDEGGAP